MLRPRTLQAFTVGELTRAHTLLAARVALMMGRKLEEGDWAHIYCAAKDIPNRGWSNLNIDVMHNGLGVEHKMLRRPADVQLRDLCGTRLMHPSATRSIRIPSTDGDPNDVMHDVLNQYARLIDERKRKVGEDAGGVEPDMRTGWLLWQASLKEFLYFEEEMLAPDPQDYIAEWKDSGGGARKTSRNLWVYEKESGRKRYSITSAAGAKIQPYFDVPPPNHPNLYILRVQGEEYQTGLIRLWITASTERELRSLVGDLSVENLGLVIAAAADDPTEVATAVDAQHDEARPLILTVESYSLLNASFPGVSDEHMVRLLIRRLERG